MGFANLDKDSGLAVLDAFLLDKSYIEGHVPTQADVAVYEAVKGEPSSRFANALRWFKHVSSFKADFVRLPGTRLSADQYGPAATKAAKADDDLDLFGSSESEDEELKAAKEARLKAYQAKKATKPQETAKSSVLIDVKPWDDTTDMAAMEKAVRQISIDGLLWGASKLVPVGYGIKKLQISCVIEDDKVGTDLIEEHITAIEDLVQSMDIASFNKI